MVGMLSDDITWCVEVNFFHAFTRDPHGVLLLWACIFCGQRSIGQMPTNMRFYLIEEEPV